MTIAQGARSQLLYKLQSAFGTNATGNYKKARFNSHSLKLDRGTVEGAEIRADRYVKDYRLTTKAASGDIEVDLCDGDHEDFIASMMFNSWGTDVISIGTTPQYLTIEDGALDITQYRLFSDMVVNQARFRWAPGEIAKATFSFVGSGLAQSGSSGGGTAVAAGTTSPYDSVNGSLFFNTPETGSEIAIVTALDFMVDNGVRPGHVIGQLNPAVMEFGRARVSGTISAYYEDATVVNRFINETAFSLVWNVTDPNSNSLEFRFENCKATGGDVPLANEQSRIITMPFVALVPVSGGSGISTPLQISRA